MRLVNQVEITAPIRFALNKLEAYDVMLELACNKNMEAQSYKRVVGETVRIEAADDAGFMYGILDVADGLRKGETLKEAQVTPYLPNRGIKFNIPLDARTPSYSDASTSATVNIPHMWEMDFWHDFLDRMAENKYNVLSLWSLSPFPSLVRIPEFPNACIDDVKITARSFKAELSGKNIYDEDHHGNLITVKKITMDEKIRFWQEVMKYAADRCIRVFLFTWNLFVYGTEDSGYDLTDDQNNPVTKEFVYCGTKALLDTYPLLAGIGVTAGENMTFNGSSVDDKTTFSSTDIGFIRETYGRGIEDYLKEHPERDITLIHRMQMARYDKIMEAYQDFPGKFEISFKYSQAHMYSSTKPKFIQEFLEEKAPDVKVWLTVRNDDYYMYRWGNPEFAKDYLANMPVDCLNGFYMGPDGFTWGRDYIERIDNKHPLFVDRMWYMFKIWGQLSYNLDLTEGYFKRELQARFGLSHEDTETLFTAWKEVSQIIPELNCTHWHHFDFQWYPEGCCMYLHKPVDKIVFANINEFVECGAIPQGEYASAQEYGHSVVNGSSCTKISPVSQAASMIKHAEAAEALLGKLELVSSDKEFQKTLGDMKAMALLGHYYGLKEQAAISLAIYRGNKEKPYQEDAVAKLTEALPYWKAYSAKSVASYIPQVLTRLCGKVDVQEFDELAELDILLAREG